MVIIMECIETFARGRACEGCRSDELIEAVRGARG